MQDYRDEIKGSYISMTTSYCTFTFFYINRGSNWRSTACRRNRIRSEKIRRGAKASYYQSTTIYEWSSASMTYPCMMWCTVVFIIMTIIQKNSLLVSSIASKSPGIVQQADGSVVLASPRLRNSSHRPHHAQQSTTVPKGYLLSFFTNNSAFSVLIQQKIHLLL